VGAWGCPEKHRERWNCNVTTEPDNSKDPTEEALDLELERESKMHGDITRVPTIDSYRALPTKLKLFYRELWKNYNYDYVLKVDDDTYVNPSRIIEQLEEESVPLATSWWGKVKCNERVNRDETFYDGKWYEPDYTSEEYPCYLGGGGNVLTRDLSDWIGENAHVLKDFQGEDISAGIWLSSRHPELLNNAHFHVMTLDYDNPEAPHAMGDKATCDASVLTAPECSMKQMEAIHKRLVDCGNECIFGCVPPA